jgi:uncharacterized caspase-like protein
VFRTLLIKLDELRSGVEMGALRKALFLLAACWIGCGPALAEKRVALVIGNSAYQKVAKLANPANDAAAVAAMFKAAGFDTVEFRLNVPANDLRKTLREFGGKSRDADIAVVYYAGHGIELDGTNYLIPVDAALDTDADVLDETIPLDRVLFAVEPAKRLRLVILDACRDNPFARTMKRTIASRAVGRGLAKVEPASPNTMIAFAAKAGSTASDGDSDNSPFAAALVAHLPKPGLDLRRAFGFVRDEVLKNTGNKQEPYVYGSLGGDDLPLIPAKPAAAPQADPQAAVRRDYELALQLATRDGWEAFLSQYPAGFYANLANGQLKKIGAEEARAAAAEKSRLAEQEKARLAAEKAKQIEVAKSTAAEQARTAAEKMAAEKQQTDTAAAELAAKRDEPRKVASLPPPSGTALSPTETITSLQLELRRVGCLATLANGEWSVASQRSLTLFNKSAGTKFDVKLASVDALEAVKAKTGRICPVVCETGYRSDGDRCVKITCRVGYELNEDGACQKFGTKKPIAKRSEENPPRAQQAPDRSTSSVARADAARANGTYKTCMGATTGCYERTLSKYNTPEKARAWCNRRPTC